MCDQPIVSHLQLGKIELRLHHVSDTGPGQDVFRYFDIVIQLLPEPGDIHLKSMGVADVLLTPYLLQ